MSTELDEFHGEAREILEGVAADLVRLEQSPRDGDLVNRIFRGAHSLKGLAGMLGFTGVSHAAHKLESVLDGVRMGRIAVTSDALDVLLDGVEVLGAMVDGVKDGEPAREDAAWAAVAERLTALAAAKPAGPAGPKKSIDPEIAKILSEYEEHRLADALAAGQKPWRLDVQFPFESFDTDLPALKERLKPYGEVITTMAGDLSAADKMGFGLLIVSAKDPSVLVVSAAIPDAKIAPVAVVELAPAPPIVPNPASDGGTFEGFSGGSALGGWGVADLPAGGSAATLSATAIDWNALAKEGEASPSSAPAVAPPVFDFRAQPAPVQVVDADADTVDRRRSPGRRATDRKPPVPPSEAVPGAGAGTGAATLRVNIDRI